jgi:hypothetical protein
LRRGTGGIAVIAGSGTWYLVLGFTLANCMGATILKMVRYGRGLGAMLFLCLPGWTFCSRRCLRYFARTPPFIAAKSYSERISSLNLRSVFFIKLLFAPGSSTRVYSNRIILLDYGAPLRASPFDAFAALSCSGQALRQQGMILLLLTRHLHLSARCAPRHRAGLFSAVPCGTGSSWDQLIYSPQSKEVCQCMHYVQQRVERRCL